MKKFILSILFFGLVLWAAAQAPAGYYNTATGSGYTLKTQLYNIIKGHTDIGYGSLWAAYAGTGAYTGKATDKRPDGKVWDMYSNCNFTFVTDQDNGSGGTSECQKFNREHSFPQSWFNSSSPMVADLFHIPPTDKKVNNLRGNFPYGTVANPSQTTGNGGKLGPCSFAGYTGTVFEPIDEYKGDFARGYFYMATRYENVISGWQNNGNANEVLDGSSNKVFDTWQLNLLYQWHIQDPVSAKEIDRNNAVYQIQGNRNPYIDNPQWVANVWGFNASTTYTVQFSATAGSIAEGNSGTQNYNATVNISPALPVGTTATVQVSLGTGSATSATDFNFTPTTLTFDNANASRQVSISVLGDTQLENNETVVLNLSTPSANAVIGANNAHTLTIQNDDTGGNPVVQFTATSGSISEGNTGNTTYNATVSISPALSTGSATVQVSLATSGTSATSGTDFNFTPTTLTFTPTTSSQQVSISVVGDTQIEADETVRLELSNPSGLVLGTNTLHTLTITNEDVNTIPTVSFEYELGEVPEGNTGTNSSYNVFVTVSPAPTANATVQVNLGANTTATNNTDVEFTPLTLNFSPTVTTRSVSLTIKGDNTFEPTEVVELILQNPTGGGTNAMVLGSPTVHTVNIENDEPEPTAIEPLVKASQIQVFPNPTKENVKIVSETTLPIQAIQVIDARGKTLQSFLPASHTKEFLFSLKDLPKGMYIFALQVGKQTVYKKVMKW
jgi:endonuclease I